MTPTRLKDNMVITDLNDPTVSLGISNEFTSSGRISVDIIGSYRMIILDLQKTKNLINHLQSMVAAYEGKSNDQSSP